MSLIDKVENLQKKPEPYRRKVLFAGVLAFMFLIVFVWFTTFDFSFGNDMEIKEAYTPFQVIKNDLGSIKDGLKSSAGDIKKLFNQLKNENGETGK
jgi:uncharacterized membrane protein YozB (DUF420 family)